MNATRSPKYLLAGALAGASSVVILMIITTLLFASGALWQYAFNSNLPVLQQTAGAAMLQDVSRVPEFLWGWRWVLVGCMVGGGLLALLDRFVQRYSYMWRRGLVAAVVFLAIGTIIVAGVLISAEQSLFQGADQSRLATLAERRASMVGQMLLGVTMAVAIAGTIWLSWSWWYARWQRWLQLDALATSPPNVDSSSDQWFAQRQARARAQRTLVLSIVGGTLVLFGALTLYGQARATIRSGDLWVEPSAPFSSVQLTFAQPARQLLVENSNGSGTVAIGIAPVSDGGDATATAELTFREGDAGFEHTALQVADLPLNTYSLSAQLREGEGGRVSFALIQRNEPLTLAAATVVGLSTSIVLALAVLLLHVRNSG